MTTNSLNGGASAPLVSIVMPVYNVEPYLPTGIDSVLSQTMKDFELIIVEDCSTDGSLAVCERYAVHPRVRLIRNERNYGLGLSRNLGMKAARGKYIYFFDSDDAIVPGALELLVQAIEETGADIVHSSVYYDPKNHEFKTGISTDVECKGELTELEGFLPQDLEERLEEEYFSNRFGPPVWLNLYRRAFLEETELLFTQAPIGEDMIFTPACLCKTGRIFRIRKPFYLYRQREGSLMHLASEAAFQRCKRSLSSGTKYLHHTLREELPRPLFDRLMKTYVDRTFRVYIYPYFQQFPDLTEEQAREMMADLLGSARQDN